MSTFCDSLNLANNFTPQISITFDECIRITTGIHDKNLGDPLYALFRAQDSLIEIVCSSEGGVFLLAKICAPPAGTVAQVEITQATLEDGVAMKFGLPCFDMSEWNYSELDYNTRFSQFEASPQVIIGKQVLLLKFSVEKPTFYAQFGNLTFGISASDYLISMNIHLDQDEEKKLRDLVIAKGWIK